MIAVEKTVGHAGDVVGHAPTHAELLDTAAKAQRHFVGVEAIPVEQSCQFPLRRHTDRQHPVAAIDPLEEKLLQGTFVGGNGRRVGHDPHARHAALAAEHLPDLRHRFDPQGCDGGPAPRDQFRYLEFHHLVKRSPPQFRAGERTVAIAGAVGGVGHERDLQEFVHGDEPQFDGIVGVVGVVGDRVGGINDLRLDQRRRCGAVLLPRGLGVEHLAGEIQAWEARVADLQKLHDAERLRVVVETAFVSQQFGKRVLAGVPQRRMADVVGQGQRLDQVFVEGQAAGERSGDTRHLQRVCEAAAVIVAVVAGEDLGLVGEPPEGGRVDDAIAVALVGAAEGVWEFVVHPAGRVGRMHRPRSEQERLPSLPVWDPGTFVIGAAGCHRGTPSGWRSG